MQGKTNIRNKNGHEWDWAWCWSSLHLFAGPAQSLWKPSGWRGSSAKLSGVAPPAHMGEIKPQIAIFLWFSFLHIAGRQQEGPLICKTPLGPAGGCLPEDRRQDVAHGATSGRDSCLEVGAAPPWLGCQRESGSQTREKAFSAFSGEMLTGGSYHAPPRPPFFHQNQFPGLSLCAWWCLRESKPMEILNTRRSEEAKDAKLQFSHGLKMTPSLA